MPTVVHGAGPTPCPFLIVGEAPGPEEDRWGWPFAGASGQELERYLGEGGVHWRRKDPRSRYDFDWSTNRAFVTNVVRQMKPKGKDVEPADVDVWRPFLKQECARVKPLYVLALGRWATREFVGEVDMESVHGIPQPLREEVRSWPGMGGVRAVLPCYHVAAGFHSPEVQPWIAWDFAQIREMLGGRSRVGGRVDEYPDSVYLELRDDEHSDSDLYDILGPHHEISIDTEGDEARPWSIQFCVEEGMGWVLRRGHADRLIRALAGALGEGSEGEGFHWTAYIHNSMHDLGVSRALGVRYGRFVDTMVLAYHIQLLPQGLKPLARRLCGMRMKSYPDVIAPAEDRITLAYLDKLEEATEITARGRSNIYIPDPAPRVIWEGGREKLYTPQPLRTWIKRMRSDIAKRGLWSEENDGGVEVRKRWGGLESDVRRPFEDLIGRMREPTLDDIPLDEAIWYAGRDPDATHRIRRPLLEAHGEMELDLVSDLDHSAIPMFERMQANGMPSDPAYFVQLAEDMQEAMRGIQRRIEERHGLDFFNPNSDQQVRELVFGQLGIAGSKKTKSGKLSTNKKALEMHRGSNETVADIADYREHGKVKDSFAIPLGAKPSPIHPRIRTTRVVTGRPSCTDPNLLAVPVRTQLGLKVRAGFVADEGDLLGTWDLDQIEMRQMAFRSRDELLMRLFWEGRDIHTNTACMVFGIKEADVHPMQHRYPSKRIGFGVITGITGQGLHDQMKLVGLGDEWPVDRCDEVILEWFKVYRGVKSYMGETRALARRQGWVKDMWGRIRYLPGVRSPLEHIREEALRQSHSHDIQAGAAGLIKRSMRQVWNEALPELWREFGEDSVQPLLQIYDELIFRFRADLWPVVDAYVMAAMTGADLSPIEFDVPIKAKGAKGRTWAELEK